MDENGNEKVPQRIDKTNETQEGENGSCKEQTRKPNPPTRLREESTNEGKTKDRQHTRGQEATKTQQLVGSKLKESKMDEDSVELDETLYSRQLFVYGDSASRKMATASVLICGLGGLGVEIAKDVILTGVGEVVLHDQMETTWDDLATQFYLTEGDLGSNRAKACVGRLAELNPYVRVATTEDDASRTLLANSSTLSSVNITASARNTDACNSSLSGDNTSVRYTDATTCHESRTTTATTVTTTATTASEEDNLNNNNGDNFRNFTTHTSSHSTGLTTELIKKFTVVVLTDSTLEDQLWVDGECRRLGVQLVVASVRGLCGQVFCDFGEDFFVADPTDRELAAFPVAEISAEGVVTLPPKTYHGLRDGDHITFKGVRGMAALNGAIHRVKVLDGQRLKIGLTLGLGEYEGGGTGQEVRLGKTFTHQPLSSLLIHPNIVALDFTKPGRDVLLHLAFLALDRYSTNHAVLPRPWHPGDADTFITLCKLLRQEGIGWEEGEEGQELELEKVEFLRLFSFTGSGAVAGVTSVVGGVAAGEVVKACSQRFSPLSQFFYFDVMECLPQDSIEQKETVSHKTRYDGLARVMGWDVLKRLRELQLMVVGAGAVGCEVMKCLALLGVGTDKEGSITLTDPDLIERSNLSRQFLFRPWHVRRHKVDAAAEGTLAINPEMQVVPLRLRAGKENAHVFDATFYEHQDTVFAAVDSAEARRHLDSWCRVAGVPLLEAGTLGTRGSTTVVVPHLTERYATLQAAPQASAPSCTLRNFPTTAEHLIQWAQNLMLEEFCHTPTHASHYIAGSLTLTQLKQEGDMAVSRVRNILLGSTHNYNDCVEWAGQQLTYHHNTDILDLLYYFPPDLKTREGQNFWSGARRCPKPTPLDLNNSLHLTYIHAAANLWAKVFGIPIEQSLERTKALLKEGVEQMVKKEEASEVQFPPTSSLPSMKLAPLAFDKDDPIQLDYMMAAAQLRGVNYHIPLGDSRSLRGAAGRVTPAVVTSSAVVAGLATLELLKVAQGHTHLQDYRIAEFNLALARYCLMPPEPPPVNMYNGIEWTDWDKFEVAGDLTLRELIDLFHRRHDLQLTLVAAGDLTLYSIILPAREKERRKDMRITEILRELVMDEGKSREENAGERTKVKIGPVIPLDICALDRDMEDIDVPFIRLDVRKTEE